MRAPLLIVGQGLAGTLLGHACERAGIAFRIADAGHANAASRVGAGIINPITGMRMVKSAGVDELLSIALTAYRDLETMLGTRFLRRMRVYRSYIDEAERTELRARLGAGKLSPYVASGNCDGAGFVIEPAWQVNLPTLIEAGREYAKKTWKLEERLITPEEAGSWPGPVVWCQGAGSVGRPELIPVRGSMLEISTGELDPETMLNRGGRWLLPLDRMRAWVGATYVRAATEDLHASAIELRRMATDLLGGRVFQEKGMLSGIRMTTADRRPLVEYVDGRGCINGLGSKGALYAPEAARRMVAAILADGV